MKINRAYKTELKPNKSQQKDLSNHCGAARFAYNWGLARRIDEYERIGRSSNAIEQHKQLNALKKTEYPWLYEVSKCAPQEGLRDLDRAFSNFFKRSELKKQGKHKEKVGFPRFKSKKHGLGSFRLTGSIYVEEKRMKLPRLGWIPLKEKGYLPQESEAIHILSAAVSERAGRWFCSLLVEEEMEEPTPACGPPVGIDLGLKNLATCSYGKEKHVHYENPRALLIRAKKLRRLQKKLSRQKKGSNQREETRKRISREHYRISCIRSDAIHKATSQIVAKAKPSSIRPCVIGSEDLNVSAMMKNHKLARSVADASIGEFQEADFIQVFLVRHKACVNTTLRANLKDLFQVWLGERGLENI